MTEVNRHTAVLYESPEERWQFLAEYYGAGFVANELCVFVTQASPEDAVAALELAGLSDAGDKHKRGQLNIFSAAETYLPEGGFISDYMLANVIEYITDAAKQGYDGLCTAGEMDWLNDHPEYNNEAHIYEHQVNQLTQDYPTFTGLCMYDVQATSMGVLKSAVETHPQFVSGQQIHYTEMA